MTKIYDLSFESALYRDDWDGHYLGKRSTTPVSLVELSQSPHITLPDLLEFETHNPERLRKVNVATANSGVKMLSQKVIDAISSTGDVDWTLIPVRFVDKSNGDEVCEGKFSGVFLNTTVTFLTTRDLNTNPETGVHGHRRSSLIVCAKKCNLLKRWF